MSYAITIDGSSQNAPAQHNNPANCYELGEGYQNDPTQLNFPAYGSERGENSLENHQWNNPANGSEVDESYQNDCTQQNKIDSEISDRFQGHPTQQNVPANDSEIGDSSQGHPTEQNVPANGSERGENSQNDITECSTSANGPEIVERKPRETVNYYLDSWILPIIFLFFAGFRLFTFAVFATYDMQCLIIQHASVIDCSQDTFVESPEVWIFVWIFVSIVSSFLFFIMVYRYRDKKSLNIRINEVGLAYKKGSFISFIFLTLLANAFYFIRAVKLPSGLGQATSVFLLFWPNVMFFVVWCLNYTPQVRWKSVGVCLYRFRLYRCLLNRCFPQSSCSVGHHIDVSTPDRCCRGGCLCTEVCSCRAGCYCAAKCRCSAECRCTTRCRDPGVGRCALNCCCPAKCRCAVECSCPPAGCPCADQCICYVECRCLRECSTAKCSWIVCEYWKKNFLFFFYWVALLMYFLESMVKILSVTLDVAYDLAPLIERQYNDESLKGMMIILISFRVAFHTKLAYFFWQKIFHGEKDLLSVPCTYLHNSNNDNQSRSTNRETSTAANSVNEETSPATGIRNGETSTTSSLGNGETSTAADLRNEETSSALSLRNVETSTTPNSIIGETSVAPSLRNGETSTANNSINGETSSSKPGNEETSTASSSRSGETSTASSPRNGETPTGSMSMNRATLTVFVGTGRKKQKRKPTSFSKNQLQPCTLLNKHESQALLDSNKP